MRLADGTAAIPPILIGTRVSRIREIGALALVVATIKSPSLGRHRTEICACLSRAFTNCDASSQLVAGKLFLERLKDK
jgi:hypothetical protein